MISDIISSGECVWNVLKKKDKPLVLYGTGNGADKIIEELEKNGISPDGIFASDGFVRDRSFHSMKVLSFSSALEKYPDMRVAIAFASSLDDVISNMQRIDKICETYAPDVPVYGGEICNADWLEKNKRQLEKVYSMLYDDESKRIFESVLSFRYTGKISFLLNNESDRKSDFIKLLEADKIRYFCDLGAFKGDTVTEMLEYNPDAEAVAFEPDFKSFSKAETLFEDNKRVKFFNYAAWSCPEKLLFNSGGGRQSRFSGEGKTKEVSAMPLDYVLEGKGTDYIKYDVEGAESEALDGSAETIRKYKPKLMVSLYHKSDDIFTLPLNIRSINPDYKFYIRRYRYIPAWDLNLICV